ncbi:MAG: hypothetical protein HQK55_06065 [Deltaproteobacteria bacterium]|nr:hypothetical protein [Deltaproteobacteria bacterium]
MVDIAALMRVLPVSALKPDCVALLGGFITTSKDRAWQECIVLLEPPAGQHAPYIDPVEALEQMLRRLGFELEDAHAQACEAVARMKDEVAVDRWVNFFDDFEPESPECLPVSDFVAWLRDERRRVNLLASHLKLDAQGFQQLANEEILPPSDIVDFLEQAAEVAASTPMFRGPDNWDEPWSLENLPALPPPKAMIEFRPGAPWGDYWEAPDNPFMRWREAIRPVARELEKALGEPVYYFADVDDELDDDAAHRFLVLHWCCTWKPESAFMRYLLKISGACDIEELKAALIDPVSYTQPFEMNDAFIRLEALTCQIDYLPPEAHKTIAVVFSTSRARETARFLLAQKIGAHAFIVAPKELATDDWIRQATRYCREWSVRYVYGGQLDEPLGILASVDELCVIADEPTPNCGFDLKLPDPVEDLLCLALDLGVEAHYFHVDLSGLWNPDTCLLKRGVPERVAARKSRRAAYTRCLKEIRLDNDFGGSGLWDMDGKMLGYDLLDLPFPLVRRIAAWQRDYDDTMDPPDMGDDAWWERHEQEAFDIARALHDALGKSVAIKVHRKQGWLTVD